MISFNSDKRLAIFKYFVIPMFVAFLSGCMGMGSKFDCNVDSEGRCAPMHHINKMVNWGEFNEGPKYRTDKENAIAKAESKIRKENNYLLSNTSGANGVPIRTNDTVQQIWIGPYEDSAGIYHEPTTIHTVVKKGQWVGVSESTKIVED